MNYYFCFLNQTLPNNLIRFLLKPNSVKQTFENTKKALKSCKSWKIFGSANYKYTMYFSN